MCSEKGSLCRLVKTLILHLYAVSYVVYTRENKRHPLKKATGKNDRNSVTTARNLNNCEEFYYYRYTNNESM